MTLQHANPQLSKYGVTGKVTGGEGRLWRLYRKPDFTAV
jgi:hypothetical protein